MTLSSASPENLRVPEKRTTSPGVLFPVLAGLFSCLALFNASRPGTLNYQMLVGQSVWFLIGALLVIAVSYFSPSDLIRYSPLAGGLCLALLYASVLVGELFYFGRRGTIGILPSYGVSAVIWELVFPVYVLWLIRFSPSRKGTGMLSWRSFLTFMGIAAAWWIPILITHSVSAIICYVLTFILLCWLDTIDPVKILSAALSLTVLGGVYLVWVASSGHISSLTFSNGDQDLFASSIGNGGLFGGSQTGAFKIKYFLSPSDSFIIFLSVVERIGLVGTGIVMAVIAAGFVWCIRRPCSQGGVVRLMIKLFISYFLFRTLIFLWAVAGMIPHVDFSLPLMNASGSDLVAVMVMLATVIPRSESRSESDGSR